MLFKYISLFFIVCTFGYCQCTNKLEWSCNVLRNINKKRICPIETAVGQSKTLTEQHILDYISGKYFANDTKYMDFSKRGIVGIVNNTFLKFSSLRALDLSSNFIESFEINTFNGLNNLLALFLCKNKLLKIDSQVFAQLTSLSILKMSSNHISKLNNGSFAKLTELVEIDLNDNEINQIESNTFDSLKELSSLDLGNNSLINIDSIFVKMNSLKRLDLSNNFLTTLSYKSLDSSTLKEIFLCKEQSGPISSSTLNLYKLIQKNRTALQMDLIHLKKSISKMVHTIKGINTIELEKASNQSGFTYYPLGRTSCRNHPSLVFNELYGHNGLCNVIERIYNVTHLVKTIEKNEDLSICKDIWSGYKTVIKNYKLESYRLTSYNLLYSSRTYITKFRFKLLVHGFQIFILSILTIAIYFKIASIKKEKTRRIMHEIQQARRRY